VKKLNSLDILSSMQEAQMIQFQAATTLVIGTIMRKVGLSELSVEPEDIDAIVTGETLRIEALPNGGFRYSFFEAKEDDAETWIVLIRFSLTTRKLVFSIGNKRSVTVCMSAQKPGPSPEMVTG